LGLAVFCSAATIAWGNGVVTLGRHYGADQWITLLAIPGFGVVGAFFLCRRGFSRQALGIRLPRADKACVLWVLVGQAVLAATVFAAIGLWAGGHEQRALRTVRTLVGTAVGEELIHRGVLVAVWASAGVGLGGVLLANMATFGLWHAAGAVCEGTHFLKDVGGPGLLAAPLLLYIRLRFGSIVAPMAFHAATNMPGVLEKPDGCRWYFTPARGVG
jgi:membrane protease YdiL (CAAX protease family)